MKRSRPNAASFYERIREILESARAGVARTVNTTHVVTNWLIGREIVEEEQRGKKRADYGESLLEDLSTRLRDDFGSGYSVPNLRNMRQFYQAYPALIGTSEIRYAARSESPADDFSDDPARILHAMREESTASPKAENSDPTHRKSDSAKSPPMAIRYAVRSESWQPGQLHPNLSWTHYRALLRVESTAARAFYEIEALQNNWSARELDRQINSLLYERLALSRERG